MKANLLFIKAVANGWIVDQGEDKPNTFCTTALEKQHVFRDMKELQATLPELLIDPNEASKQ